MPAPEPTARPLPPPPPAYPPPAPQPAYAPPLPTSPPVSAYTAPQPLPIARQDRPLRVSVAYGAAAPPHAWAERLVRGEDLLGPVATMVGKLVELPRPISFQVRECTELAYWSGREASLVVCYRYLSFVRQVVGDGDLRAVFLFTVLHEVAHALIGELGLPVVGRDEDAADRFAATFLLANSRLESLLMPSARFFHRLSQLEAPSLWDEHSTDGQRYYDLLCLAAGASPHSVSARELPAERRERCGREYERAWTGWDRLLTPHSHVRTGETFWPR